MIEVRYFVDRQGREPLLRWFDDLEREALRRVDRAVSRLAEGNTSNAKSVGEGVHELKIDFEPGYRVYFGRQGSAIVVLLGGGTKKKQAQDIATAKERWAYYRRTV
ncbi:MAG TPA: type II toxin-antitoxin system RelE/ParE family toxin [Rhizomicrobium sp.]